MITQNVMKSTFYHTNSLTTDAIQCELQSLMTEYSIITVQHMLSVAKNTLKEICMELSWQSSQNNHHSVPNTFFVGTTCNQY